MSGLSLTGQKETKTKENENCEMLSHNSIPSFLGREFCTTVDTKVANRRFENNTAVKPC